ncbi:MAG TPA: hypothetical protein GX528_02510 [Firmicutes bacterium]|nr:hypothetical protein [Bacillota bacterium]
MKFEIVPQEIYIVQNQTHIDLKLKVRTSGLGSYTLHRVHVTVEGEDGEELFEPKTQEINISRTIVPGVPFDIDLDPIRLDGIEGLYSEELYEEHLKGRVFTLEITLEATKNSSNTAKLIFQ